MLRTGSGRIEEPGLHRPCCEIRTERRSEGPACVLPASESQRVPHASTIDEFDGCRAVKRSGCPAEDRPPRGGRRGHAACHGISCPRCEQRRSRSSLARSPSRSCLSAPVRPRGARHRLRYGEGRRGTREGEAGTMADDPTRRIRLRGVRVHNLKGSTSTCRWIGWWSSAASAGRGRVRWPSTRCMPKASVGTWRRSRATRGSSSNVSTSPMPTRSTASRPPSRSVSAGGAGRAGARSAASPSWTRPSACSSRGRAGRSASIVAGRSSRLRQRPSFARSRHCRRARGT